MKTILPYLKYVFYVFAMSYQASFAGLEQLTQMAQKIQNGHKKYIADYENCNYQMNRNKFRYEYLKKTALEYNSIRDPKTKKTNPQKLRQLELLYNKQTQCRDLAKDRSRSGAEKLIESSSKTWRQLENAQLADIKKLWTESAESESQVYFSRLADDNPTYIKNETLRILDRTQGVLPTGYSTAGAGKSGLSVNVVHSTIDKFLKHNKMQDDNSKDIHVCIVNHSNSKEIFFLYGLNTPFLHIKTTSPDQIPKPLLRKDGEFFGRGFVYGYISSFMEPNEFPVIYARNDECPQKLSTAARPRHSSQ